MSTSKNSARKRELHLNNKQHTDPNMNTNNPTRLTNLTKYLAAQAATALFATAALSTNAQGSTWLTVYDGPGHVYSALLDPFPSQPQPSLFSGGMSSRSPSSNPFAIQWIGPLDGVTLPSAVISDSHAWTCYKLGFDSFSGLLYSVGAGAVGWEVRASADGGNSWMTVDTPFAATAGTYAMGFAADGAGNAFVCGYAGLGFLVRKRNSSGAWATIQNWGPASSRNFARAEKMHITSGYLFVVGTTDNLWAVQRMNLASGSWDTPYTGAPIGPKGKSNGGAVAVTSWGTDIYTLAWAGSIQEASKSVVLLKGANLGKGPWTTVKTFTESPNINRPGDLAFDHSGNLFVAGDSTFYTTVGAWTEAWIVRRCDAITGAWQSWTPLTSDPATQRSFARQVSVHETTGSVYVTGTAQPIVNGQVTQNWRTIVQKWVP